MAILKDGRFWGGVIVGFLLPMLIPQLNVRARAGLKAG